MIVAVVWDPMQKVEVCDVLGMVRLFNQMNKLAGAYSVEPDILPRPARTDKASP